MVSPGHYLLPHSPECNHCPDFSSVDEFWLFQVFCVNGLIRIFFCVYFCLMYFLISWHLGIFSGCLVMEFHLNFTVTRECTSWFQPLGIIETLWPIGFYKGSISIWVELGLGRSWTQLTRTEVQSFFSNLL